MYCRVLAVDFDGTGASNDHLAPEVDAALAAARETGIATLLVTGRVLEDLVMAGVELARFDAVVAENGAIVFLPASGRTLQIGDAPPAPFLGALRARNVPVRVGTVVVATWDRHAGDVLAAIREQGIDAQIVFNRAAVMVLPSGVTKAVGVRRALEELGRSERNMIAFGDAENDHPLLAVAEVAVAPRGAVPAIAALADTRLTLPGAAGVAQYVRHLVAAEAMVPTPPRHRIVIGRDATGAPAAIPASGCNVMISGDPRGGKSWIAGLLVERLLDRGYRLCVVDPEGDHAALGERPGVLTLGGDLPLPDPERLPRVLRNEPVSLVLDLSALEHERKLAWADAALCALEQSRAASGLPHWIVVDEAHYFFHEHARCPAHFESRTGGYVFVTYRPSMVAPRVFDAVGAHVVIRTDSEAERYFLHGLLQARAPRDLVVAEALDAVQPPDVGLLLVDPEAPRWQVFRPAERRSEHVHHGRKYADVRLPEQTAFRFSNVNGAGPVVAHNVREFCNAVLRVPLASLEGHMRAGDFSRWTTDVLGDAALAAGLRKLERTVASGGGANRNEILAHVLDRYEL